MKVARIYLPEGDGLSEGLRYKVEVLLSTTRLFKLESNMQITPYENGIHSIAEGLRSLMGFLDAPESPYLMKDAIIRLHHGLETLLKDILFQRNPVFIISEKTTVTQILTYYKKFYEHENNYLLDEAITITPTEALKRIQDLYFGSISKQEYAQLTKAFNELNVTRNLLQHFAIKWHPEITIRTLGNLIPKSLKLIKSCYAIDNENPIRQRIDMIPHVHLNGMDGGFFVNVDEDLKKIYPNSLDVITLLEDRFDKLLTEAVARFKRAKFDALPLKFSLTDHGIVGAPPHMPDFELTGWLNGTFSSHTNSVNRSFYRSQDQFVAMYNAETTFTNPETIEEIDPDTYLNRIKMAFSIKSTITEIKSDQVFSIEQAKDYIPFIRTPEINILINFEIEAIVMRSRAHFHIHSLTSLKGSSETKIESSVFGDAPGKPSVSGLQQIDLNEKNTSIEFHAFVKPNDTLSENFSLKIAFNSTADLIFG